MTRKELEDKIEASTAEELSFLLSSYGGRNRSILRDKIFGESADIVEKLLKRAIEYKTVDQYLLGDN